MPCFFKNPNYILFLKTDLKKIDSKDIGGKSEPIQMEICAEENVLLKNNISMFWEMEFHIHCKVSHFGYQYLIISQQGSVVKTREKWRLFDVQQAAMDIYQTKARKAVLFYQQLKTRNKENFQKQKFKRQINKLKPKHRDKFLSRKQFVFDKQKFFNSLENHSQIKNGRAQNLIGPQSQKKKLPQIKRHLSLNLFCKDSAKQQVKKKLNALQKIQSYHEIITEKINEEDEGNSSQTPCSMIKNQSDETEDSDSYSDLYYGTNLKKKATKFHFYKEIIAKQPSESVYFIENCSEYLKVDYFLRLQFQNEISFQKIDQQVWIGVVPQDREDFQKMRKELRVTQVLDLRCEGNISQSQHQYKSYLQKSNIRYKNIPIQPFDPLDFINKIHGLLKFLQLLVNQNEVIYIHSSHEFTIPKMVAILYNLNSRQKPIKKLSKAIESVCGRGQPSRVSKDILQEAMKFRINSSQYRKLIII